jgi:ElaB/YqjD/DUF883 family membrane-anchored ribosome-binding protein
VNIQGNEKSSALKTRIQFFEEGAKMDRNNLSNTANETLDTARDMGRDAMDKGREAIDKGYDTARDYVSKGADYAGEVSDSLTDFVQRQPWLALAGAFIVGYVAAKALRQVSL